MLSYIGGKSKIGKWIKDYYPTDMETYVETFGGMFWCFFNMDLSKYPNLKRVVYNDFNPLNYNLFMCLQNPSVLLNAVNSIPCQERGVENTPSIYKEQFNLFQQELFATGFTINYPDYDVAAKYAYILTSIFSGSRPETSGFIDLKGKYKSKFLTFRDKLSKPDWVEHFNKISHFRLGDFGDVIDEFDSPTTYFYVDPPYWKTENYYSNHDFDVDDHKRLADKLTSISGKFSLSYYDFDLLSLWYPKETYKWEMKEFAKAASATKGKTQNMGQELLIMNY
jgi:DNA adenine methylase